MAWRAKGQVQCSNGASFCRATFPNAITSEHPLKQRDESTGTSSDIVEVVDENDDGLPEYVVFAGLAQDVYYHQGLKANWFNGFAPNETSPFALPKNVLKFIGCRATDAVELMDAPLTNLAAPKEAPVGRVFAWKEVCEHYNKTGEMRGAPDIAGTWYMEDKELNGYES